jgi:hypothetical protein
MADSRYTDELGTKLYEVSEIANRLGFPQLSYFLYQLTRVDPDECVFVVKMGSLDEDLQVSKTAVQYEQTPIGVLLSSDLFGKMPDQMQILRLPQNMGREDYDALLGRFQPEVEEEKQGA